MFASISPVSLLMGSRPVVTFVSGFFAELNGVPGDRWLLLVLVGAGTVVNADRWETTTGIRRLFAEVL
jgi:hypothetical protein